MKSLIALFALFVASASGADISGTWKGSAETANGTLERTFVFKQAGTTLTGESSSEMTGKSTITDGKVEGDTISFTLTINLQGNEMKLKYAGKVTGDAMKLHVEGAGFEIDYAVKKTS